MNYEKTDRKRKIDAIVVVQSKYNSGVYLIKGCFTITPLSG